MFLPFPRRCGFTDAARIAREDPLYAMKHHVVDEANQLILKDVSHAGTQQFELVSEDEDDYTAGFGESHMFSP